jgi:hypothetical protein
MKLLTIEKRKQVEHILGPRTVYAILLEGRVVGSSERKSRARKDANEGLTVSEEQYQERFWQPRLDGIALDTATKEFLAIEFNRTQDARSNYVEKGNNSCSGAVQEFANGSPIGRSSQWVESTRDSVCRRDVQIHSC